MTTQIEERLAEALRKCEAAFSDIFAQCASNGMKNAWGHPVDHTQLNKANCMTGSVLREYDRLRTHPAEGGVGRDEMADSLRCYSDGYTLNVADKKLIHAAADLIAAAPPPQPVAPAEGGEGRDYEATLACPRCGRRRTTGAGRLPDWPACCNLVCHCTCHNDPLYCRECKDCDCHKAAPPPQPVAPERGEAKAVAWITESALLDLERWTQAGRVACATVWNGQDAVRKIPVYLATPQPPPAPTFRDPTIEDDLRAIADDVDPNHDPMPSNHPLWDPYKQADRLRQIANAIGAKVEEK